MNKLTLFLIVTLFSCQSSRELHYFKQGDNYYRLRINQAAIFSSSRYMAGYYDERAVDNYFGEISRPDSAKVANAKLETVTDAEISKHKKLILLLSTNADVVADQISNFAQNEETLELIARLANKDKVELNAELKNEISTIEQENTGLIKAGQEYLGTLDLNNIPTSKNYLLAFIIHIAAIRGRKNGFTTWDEAKNWYENEF
ncbi:MAG: hypothetical protein AAFX57_07485 [Bacteroidota bacterium]